MIFNYEFINYDFYELIMIFNYEILNYVFLKFSTFLARYFTGLRIGRYNHRDVVALTITRFKLIKSQNFNRNAKKNDID